MSEAVVDDIVAVLPPLLQSLEALGFIARHLNPPDFGKVMQAAGTPDAALQSVRSRLTDWPAEFADVRTCAGDGERCRTGGFAGLARGAEWQWRFDCGVSRIASRARARRKRCTRWLQDFRRSASFFVDPALRDDADLLARLAEPAHRNTGIIHDHNEPGSRGGFSLYVPEYYTPDRAWPLVMALHGGSGNGRGFLWSWLRDARSHGAILVAPTATGSIKAPGP